MCLKDVFSSGDTNLTEVFSVYIFIYLERRRLFGICVITQVRDIFHIQIQLYGSRSADGIISLDCIESKDGEYHSTFVEGLKFGPWLN